MKTHSVCAAFVLAMAHVLLHSARIACEAQAPLEQETGAADAEVGCLACAGPAAGAQILTRSVHVLQLCTKRALKTYIGCTVCCSRSGSGAVEERPCCGCARTSS